MIDYYAELAEPSRRAILAELRTGPKTVTELVEASGLKQPNVSNHLARMRQRGTVKATKVGRLVYYALSSPEVEALVVAALEGSNSSAAETAELAQLVEPFAKAASAGDEAACTRIVDRAISVGHDMITIYQDLFAPAMILVGDWWADGKIDIAHEHLATALTERHLSRVSQTVVPRKKYDGVAILGCAESSWHTVALRMFADYLRAQGWRTLFLGANVPQESFVRAIREYQPELVLINCTACESVAPTRTLLQALDSLQNETNFSVGLGGWCVNHFPEQFADVPVTFIAADIKSFATTYLPRIEHAREGYSP